MGASRSSLSGLTAVSTALFDLWFMSDVCQ
jgi:hypothetical protein